MYRHVTDLDSTKVENERRIDTSLLEQQCMRILRAEDGQGEGTCRNYCQSYCVVLDDNRIAGKVERR